MALKELDMPLLTLAPCAVQCLDLTKLHSSPTTLCGSTFSRQDVDSCLMSSCSLLEAFSTRRLIEVFCETPVRNKTAELDRLNLCFGSVTVVIVSTRALFNLFIGAKHGLKIDDWLLLIAAPLGLATIILLTCGLNANGFGKDIWGTDLDSLVSYGIYFYVIEILYLVLMTLAKVALAFFYVGLFPAKNIRRLLFAVILFHVIAGIAFVLKVIFQCTPASYNWNKYSGNPQFHGHCVNINLSSWINGAIGVASDFVLLAIPLSQVKGLNLHWRKKIEATLMFMTGMM
ncbi:hypothetical protein QQS21_003288 [Conoideocrella luteorostrata]|uniref:Rhodopsin domain-containing protein n=1 Tax=Conoideocrella luteorostrata TaxID=1105319 RepID=A0AAJ0CTI1_9HYPO|nr:hypothetical protein QQS21_003288 [Conoideocrella luteorostrata]